MAQFSAPSTSRPRSLGHLLRCPRCGWASFSAAPLGHDWDQAERLVMEHGAVRHPGERLRLEDCLAAATERLAKARS